MSKQDLLKVQTYVLKVNIHCECDGCEQKVRKLLQKIDGVYSVSVDAGQGKVVVSGHVDPDKLIKKLKRSGKHAEIWGGQRGIMMYNQNQPTNNQFKNLQLDNGKGGKDKNKSQNHHKGEKGSGNGQVAHFQNFKGTKDPKVPAKDQKSVKFKLPGEEFDGADGFDESSDYDEEFEDDLDEDGFEDEEEGGYNGHHVNNQMMPVNMMGQMGNVRGPHGPGPKPAMNNQHKGKSGGGGNDIFVNANKADTFDLPEKMKGKGVNYNEGKIDNGGKKSNNGDGKGGKKKGGKHKGGGGGGNKKKVKSGGGGGLLGRFLGLGKKSKEEGASDTKKKKNKEKNNDDGNNKGNKKEGKKGGGGKLEADDFDFSDFHIPKIGKGGSKGTNGGGSANGIIGQMGPMGQKGPSGHNYPMDHQMRNFPAAMNGGGGGYYQGMQMQQPSPYDPYQQQQYMAMMMNQQQQQQQQQQANMNDNNMYPPAHMMYGRPHPSMMMPPPPMPSHPMNYPMTHVFSDENAESCIIM